MHLAHLGSRLSGCWQSGRLGGLWVLAGGNLLLIVVIEPALNQGTSSALAMACIAVWVDEEGVLCWGEGTNVTDLPGARAALGDGEGSCEDWESDDSCPPRDMVGSSSSLKTSKMSIS